MKKISCKRSLCALFLFVSLTIGCTSNKPQQQFLGTTKPKHPANEMWINNSVEPQHIDPQLSTGVPDGEIVRNIFSRLTQIHPTTGLPVPDLAERWEISSDGTEYTFFLRKTVWSDGHPLTSHDLEYGWKRLLDPAMGAEYASLAYDITNAEPFNRQALFVEGLSEKMSIEEVKKLFEAFTPVSSVTISAAPIGFFVYVDPGKDGDANAIREMTIKHFHDMDFSGQKLSVKIADYSVVQAKAVDDLTFKVKLNGPLPYFLYLAEFTAFAPAPQHVIEPMIKKVGLASQEMWTRAENLVCSGPYCLTEEKFRQYKIMTKNPNFWDAKKVRIEKIKLLSIESYNTTMFFYQTGEIDWIGNGGQVPAEYINYVKHLKDYANDPYLGIYYYGINVTRKPLDDVRVRKALSLAVDRKAVTDLIGADRLPYASMVPDGLAGYKGLNLPIFDKEKAKQFLADAGYPGGKGFPTMRIMYNTTELHKQIAEAIQQMWVKNLNINIELQNKEWKTYLDDMTAKNYDIVRRGWIGDFPDPFTFLDTMQSFSGNNRTGWKNLEYDRLLKTANMESDLVKRSDIMRQAETIAMDEQAFIPLFVYTSPYFKKPYLKGFWPNIQNHHEYRYWWVDERYYTGVPTEPVEDIPNLTLEGN